MQHALPHSARRVLLALLAALTLTVALPQLARADTLAVSGATSDNYKARWNADPSVPERRIWLSLDSVVGGGGAVWTPAPVAATTISSGPTIALTSNDGRTGQLTLAVTRGSVDWTYVRSDPAGRWGPLLSLTAGSDLADHPLSVTATLTSGGSTVASGVLEYRSEPAFAAAAPSSIEYNGPGGRWYVGGVAVRTDWDPPGTPVTLPATTPAPTTAATPANPPRVVSIVAASHTTSRRLLVRVTGRAGSSTARLTSIRMGLAGHAFSSWVPVARTYAVRLPAGVHTWVLRVQLRDARGHVSAVAVHRVRCTC